MNTYRGSGLRITYTNSGSAIASGDVVVIKSGLYGLIGIAVAAIAATTGTGEVQLEGVHELPAGSTVTAAIGAAAYWDGSEITTTSTSNTLAGIFETAKTNGQTTARIKINGCPVTLTGAATLTGVETLTNKTLTGPVLTAPQINDTSADHQYVFAVNELAADRTVTLPLLTGDDTFVFASFIQTLSNKTLAAPVITGLTQGSYTATPVAAAGSTVADAGQLPSTGVCHITSDGATKGVKLPAVTVAGVQILVVNNSSTAAELYAESTGTVNGLSADASVVVPASKGLLCISTAAKTWIAFDTTAKATAS